MFNASSQAPTLIFTSARNILPTCWVRRVGDARAQPAMSCTMSAIWGSRTTRGNMYSHRNLDWLSQTGIHDQRLITVYRPEGKRPFVTMGFAGVCGALAGMNERGITISEVGTFSVSEELDGIPWALMA